MDMRPQVVENKEQKEKPKRIKERYIGEAMELVNRWRFKKLKINKFKNYIGNFMRLVTTQNKANQQNSLLIKQQKQLEFQEKHQRTIIINQSMQVASVIQINLENIKEQKMGVIRRLVRESKEVNKQLKLQEKIKLEEIQKQFNPDQFIISEEEQRARSNSFEFEIQQNFIEEKNNNIQFDSYDSLFGNQTFINGQVWRHCFLKEKQQQTQMEQDE